MKRRHPDTIVTDCTGHFLCNRFLTHSAPLPCAQSNGCAQFDKSGCLHNIYRLKRFTRFVGTRAARKEATRFNNRTTSRFSERLHSCQPRRIKLWGRSDSANFRVGCPHSRSPSQQARRQKFTARCHDVGICCDASATPHFYTSYDALMLIITNSARSDIRH